MLDNLTTQQRVLLATVLSFLFFLGYDHFFIPKNTNQNIQIEKNISTSGHSAPIVNNQTSDTNAPAAANLPASNAVSAPASPGSLPTTESRNIIAVVNSKNYEIHIDNLGRIAQYIEKTKAYKGENLDGQKLFDNTTTLRPLEMRFSNAKINSDAFKVSYTVDKDNITVSSNPETIVLTQKLNDLTIVKTVTFYPTGSYHIDVKLSEIEDYFISPGARPNVLADGFTFHGTLIIKADETIEKIDDGDAKGGEEFRAASVASMSDRYYTTAFYEFDKRMNIILSKDQESNPEVFIKGSKELALNGYIGPKEYNRLESVDKRLVNIIEYGFFTFIAKYVFLFLKYLHSYIGNWGWSIVAVTILIRLVLYPLTYKGMVSMNKLKELSPKVKEIQKKYKGDPQKMNAHMMDLYKKNNANPMGGCLPMIMQIPVFFAIYRVLLNAIELKSAPWILWIEDLSVLDPYYILPVLMGATMFWHQRITPTNFTDPMQEKIMKFLPLIFTFFFVTFPAGLTLYWFVNNLFSIVQQYYVNSIFNKKKELKAKE